MSIKSDNWIRKMCEPPTHVHEKIDGSKEFITTQLSMARQNSLIMDDLLEKATSNVFNVPNHMASTLKSVRPQELIRRITVEELETWKPMIEPFSPKLVGSVDGQKIVSYGTSSYGYDIRCAREFKVFTNINSTVVDPKNFDPKSFVEVESDCCIIPPNSFALARTMEYFRIPRSVLTVCLGKSTYARCGIIVNVTPFEPEWEGHVTLEFSNTTPLPAKIYAGEGCAQVLFFESDEVCETSYKDRGGKYQGQTGLTLAKV